MYVWPFQKYICILYKKIIFLVTMATKSLINWFKFNICLNLSFLSTFQLCDVKLLVNYSNFLITFISTHVCIHAVIWLEWWISLKTTKYAKNWDKSKKFHVNDKKWPILGTGPFLVVSGTSPLLHVLKYPLLQGTLCVVWLVLERKRECKKFMHNTSTWYRTKTNGNSTWVTQVTL